MRVWSHYCFWTRFCKCYVGLKKGWIQFLLNSILFVSVPKHIPQLIFMVRSWFAFKIQVSQELELRRTPCNMTNDSFFNPFKNSLCTKVECIALLDSILNQVFFGWLLSQTNINFKVLPDSLNTSQWNINYCLDLHKHSIHSFIFLANLCSFVCWRIFEHKIT